MKIKDLIKQIIEEEVEENGGDILVALSEKSKILTKQEKFESLREKYKDIFFGEGTVEAKLVLVAESPWQEKAWFDLLDKILAAINLRRKNVFLTYISCQEIFDEQIKIIQPELIVPLGNTASQVILNTDKEITETRGEEYFYKKIKVIPTFHPAYLLRDSFAKKMAWEDFQKIRDVLNK